MPYLSCTACNEWVVIVKSRDLQTAQSEHSLVHNEASQATYKVVGSLKDVPAKLKDRAESALNWPSNNTTERHG